MNKRSSTLLSIRRRFGIRSKVAHYKNVMRMISRAQTPKFFGIGFNKTGTKSLTQAMLQLGFIVGHQRTAEYLFLNWNSQHLQPLFRYCQSAEFFQDVPFSIPNVYKDLDQRFPDSKFILTVRDSSEQWYESVLRFHALLMGIKGRFLTLEELQQIDYFYQGYIWDLHQTVREVTEDNYYDRQQMIASYEKHNSEVQRYFQDRSDQLLILNVAQPDAYKQLANFVGTRADNQDFPWKNRSS